MPKRILKKDKKIKLKQKQKQSQKVVVIVNNTKTRSRKSKSTVPKQSNSGSVNIPHMIVERQTNYTPQQKKIEELIEEKLNMKIKEEKPNVKIKEEKPNEKIKKEKPKLKISDSIKTKMFEDEIKTMISNLGKKKNKTPKKEKVIKPSFPDDRDEEDNITVRERQNETPIEKEKRIRRTKKEMEETKLKESEDALSRNYIRNPLLSNTMSIQTSPNLENRSGGALSKPEEDFSMDSLY